MDISNGYVFWISLDMYVYHLDIFSGYLLLLRMLPAQCTWHAMLQ
jgi:hypothetical protein